MLPYKFQSEWFVDILKSRLLADQCRRLKHRLRLEEEFKKEQVHRAVRSKFPKHQVEIEGFLWVRKAKRTGYKKRYCVLRNCKLTFYREKPTDAKSPAKSKREENRRTEINLNSSTATVSHYDGRIRTTFLNRYNLSESNAFVIGSDKYTETKSSNEGDSYRTFLCVAPDKALHDVWMMRIDLQIGFAKLAKKDEKKQSMMDNMSMVSSA